MMVHGAVLGVAKGDKYGPWTVDDISYSSDGRKLYLHMSKQRSARAKREFRVEDFSPMDPIDYSTTREWAP